MEVNILDNQGNNPFFAACAANNLKGAKILWVAGCNPNNINDVGLRAIDIAEARRHTEIVQYIKNLEDYIDMKELEKVDDSNNVGMWEVSLTVCF